MIDERRAQMLACDHYPDRDSIEVDDDDGRGNILYIADCRKCLGLIRSGYTRADPANADWHMPESWLPGA